MLLGHQLLIPCFLSPSHTVKFDPHELLFNTCIYIFLKILQELFKRQLYQQSGINTKQHVTLQLHTYSQHPKVSDVSIVCSSATWFLNQVHTATDRRTPGFLKLFLCGCAHVCVCVSPPPRLLITSGMMWRDMDSIRLVKQVLQLLYGNCSRYR